MAIVVVSHVLEKADARLPQRAGDMAEEIPFHTRAGEPRDLEDMALVEKEGLRASSAARGPIDLDLQDFAVVREIGRPASYAAADRGRRLCQWAPPAKFCFITVREAQTSFL